MNKRDFLGVLASVGLSAVSFASPVESKLHDKKFVFVLLRGAMDGMSLFVPHGIDDYYSLRPNVAVPQKDVIKINDKFGFHPVFNESLVDFYRNDELIVIPQAGQANNSRSHFQAQDEMEYGNKKIKSQDGFLNRLAFAVKDEHAMSFTSGLPEIFKGGKTINNMNLDVFYSNIMREQEQSIGKMYESNERLLSNYNNILKTNYFFDALLKSDPAFKSRNLGEKIGIVMSKAGINISFVDLLEGWDTHVRQGVMDGKLYDLFDQMSMILVGMKKGLAQDWKNTTVVIVSEFGRSIKENGAQGTEHGHGNTMLITGGNVRKSQIIGDIKSLKLKDSHDERDLYVSYDYREVMGSLFMKHLNLPKDTIDLVLPGLEYSFKEIF